MSAARTASMRACQRPPPQSCRSLTHAMATRTSWGTDLQQHLILSQNGCGPPPPPPPPPTTTNTTTTTTTKTACGSSHLRVDVSPQSTFKSAFAKYRRVLGRQTDSEVLVATIQKPFSLSRRKWLRRHSVCVGCGEERVVVELDLLLPT